MCRPEFSKLGISIDRFDTIIAYDAQPTKQLVHQNKILKHGPSLHPHQAIYNPVYMQKKNISFCIVVVHQNEKCWKRTGHLDCCNLVCWDFLCFSADDLIWFVEERWDDRVRFVEGRWNQPVVRVLDKQTRLWERRQISRIALSASIRSNFLTKSTFWMKLLELIQNILQVMFPKDLIIIQIHSQTLQEVWK